MRRWLRRFRPSRARLRKYEAESWRAKYQLLLAATPAATRAQRQQDKHPHGYRHRHERIRTLIAFNDLFVDTVLLVPPEVLPGFVDQLYKDMKQYCHKRREPYFSKEQFEAIVSGLGREIAVLNGAKTQGLAARMTSRIEDGLGVDMQVSDPKSRRYVNIDCKALSAFRHRVNDLVREEKLSHSEADAAMDNRYVAIESGHRANRFAVVLLCVDPRMLGDVEDFSFTHTGELGALLREILNRHGLADGGYGRPIGQQLDTEGQG